MYYIGYTSVIAGEDSTVFDYLNWCYGAEEDSEEIIEYPVGYFFTGDNEDENYVIATDSSQVDRQLYAQYPSSETIERAVVMQYFNDDESKEINQMWINVRCFNIADVPIFVWGIIGGVVVIIVALIIRKRLMVDNLYTTPY